MFCLHLVINILMSILKSTCQSKHAQFLNILKWFEITGYQKLHSNHFIYVFATEEQNPDPLKKKIGLTFSSTLSDKEK